MTLASSVRVECRRARQMCVCRASTAKLLVRIEGVFSRDCVAAHDGTWDVGHGERYRASERLVALLWQLHSGTNRMHTCHVAPFSFRPALPGEPSPVAVDSDTHGHCRPVFDVARKRYSPLIPFCMLERHLLPNEPFAHHTRVLKGICP